MSDEWKAPGADERSPEGERRENDRSWKLLEKSLLASVQEQRRARRWGIFFKLGFLLLGIIALLTYYDSTFGLGGDTDR